MIILDTDILIEIFDRKSRKGDEALKLILKSGEYIGITSINLLSVPLHVQQGMVTLALDPFEIRCIIMKR